jgi:glycosyltransferase involved in cell wall biosynthesis
LEDLLARGVALERCGILPPFHTVERQRGVRTEPNLSSELSNRRDWLFVGRLSPNKGHRHVIRAFGYYRRYFGGRGHLHLVGNYDPGMHEYWEDLKLEVARWGLQDVVHFPGKVSTSLLVTYYRNAAYFVCASEHEGFCVPLVEAMHHGLPIVAYAGTAVPETVGAAALVWETPSPMLMAASIAWLEDNPAERKLLIARQKERYDAEFSGAVIGSKFLEMLAPFLPGTLANA